MSSNLQVLSYSSEVYNGRKSCLNKEEIPSNSLPNETKDTILPGFLQCMIHWDSSNVHFEYLTLPPGCWRYRGEGNANIVIALKDEATIIRLSKNYSGVSWSEHHKKKVERQVVFTTHVFAPLLGKYFVAKVRAVYVSPEQIQQLNECLQRIRPRHRMHKELKVPYAAAHSDFARTLKFSSEDVDYCVEIKPKKGWWVKLHGMGDTRPNLCTYCLNQYQKLKKSKISSRSNYCPLDLFSGNPARIVQAVISLLANPQNNLRIFRDGRLVYSDGNKSNLYKSLEAVINEWMLSSSHQLPTSTCGIGPLKNLVYLICLALLKPHSESTDAESGMNRFFQLKNELEELIINHPVVDQDDLLSVKLNEKKCKESERKSCVLESAELPLGSVLSRILNAQKLEDSDSKNIRKIYKKVCPLHADTKLKNSKRIAGFSFDECPSTKCISVESWLDEMPVENLLHKDLVCVQRHLLAATVKDCSVMMTFSPISSIRQDWSAEETGDSVLQDLRGGLHRSRVGIVDLDPKPISAIIKHHLREAEMIKAYNSSAE